EICGPLGVGQVRGPRGLGRRATYPLKPAIAGWKPCPNLTLNFIVAGRRLRTRGPRGRYRRAGPRTRPRMPAKKATSKQRSWVHALSRGRPSYQHGLAFRAFPGSDCSATKSASRDPRPCRGGKEAAYSTTSSPLASICGTLRPSALAVLRCRHQLKSGIITNTTGRNDDASHQHMMPLGNLVPQGSLSVEFGPHDQARFLVSCSLSSGPGLEPLGEWRYVPRPAFPPSSRYFSSSGGGRAPPLP